MLVFLFSSLVCPFAMLVLGCGSSVCGWAGASLAVKVLGCELGALVCPFSGLACALGTLVSAFSVSVCGWVGASLVVKVLG